MKITLKPFSLFLIVWLPFIIMANSNDIDSLHNIINQTTDKENIAEMRLELAWLKKYEDVENCILTAKSSIRVLEAAKNEPAIAIGYSYLGVFMYLTDSLPEAIEYLNIAEKYFLEQENDFRLTKVYNNLGICYSSMYNNEKALTYYQKCLEIKEKTPETSNIGNNLINISSIYYDEGNYTECIKTNEQALISTLQHNDIEGTAVVYANLGAAHERLGNYQESVNYALKALSIYQNELNNETAVIRTYSNLGSTYLSQGMTDKARYYFGLALDLNPSTQVSSMQAVIFNNLGELERISGNYDKALEYTFHALEIIESINYIEEKLISLQELSMIFENDKQFEKALFYHKQYIELSDSIIDIEQSYETQMALTQNQLSINRIQKEQENQRNQIITKKVNSMIGAFWFWIGLIIIGILTRIEILKAPKWVRKLLNYFLPVFGADLAIMYIYLSTDLPKSSNPGLLLVILITPIILSGIIHLYLSKLTRKKAND